MIDMTWLLQELDMHAGLIYQVASSIFGATFVFTILVSTRDPNRLWHAYSLLLLMLTIITVGFAMLRTDQMIIPAPVLSGLIRLGFIVMATVAMAINVYIVIWLMGLRRNRYASYRQLVQ